MRFTAVSIGGAVPRREFDGAVQSSFPSAANLRLDHDGTIITLLASGDNDLPQGIRLQAPAEVTLNELRPGERAACRAGVLRFETFPMTIDLRPAQRWISDLPALRADLGQPHADRAWKATWEALTRRQTARRAELVAGELFSLESGSLTCQKVGRTILEIASATRRLVPGEAAASCCKLIGLGQGLTPSGDDLLVGYLAGLWSTVRDCVERRVFLQELGEAISHSAAQTTDLSRTYLILAAKGQVSRSISALIEAISQGWETDPLLTTAEKMMSMGHTSGMDMATGLLVGLGVWDGESFIQRSSQWQQPNG
jgi:hypothetical protein